MKTENLTLSEAYEALKQGYRVKNCNEAFLDEHGIMVWKDRSFVFVSNSQMYGWQIIQDEPRYFEIVIEKGSNKVEMCVCNKQIGAICKVQELVKAREIRDGEIVLSREKFRQALHKHVVAPLRKIRGNDIAVPISDKALEKELFGKEQ